MKSAEIERLIGSLATVAFSDGDEPVRVLAVRDPSEREVEYGHTSKRVDVRRFLTGGYVDTWVLPRDVRGQAEPDDAVLRIIAYVENEIGPKPVAA